MKALILHADAQGLKKAVEILKKGGLVIYPTETAYGIGCDATSKKAVKRLFRIKKRSSKKPLSVIFGSMNRLNRYVYLDKHGITLIKSFMPGPLTLVAKPKKRLPGSPRNEIAFRIPSGKFALSLAKSFPKPITATSANVSGEKPVYAFGDAFELFRDKIDAIVDGGRLPKRKVSTVFNLIAMKTVRKGAVSEAKIKKCLLRKRAR
ncbi:MAG: threonylcarbamoyl-AMP synthase [Candidatus Aenigmarchaeota archaeon]|nr:threonylcarbamoyl-AMP synthase [Candidatus Aenigmarchaeota archaeon]